MTVRPQFTALFAAIVLLLGAGCGGGGSTVFTAETDDRNYQEGQRLVKQGRHEEALLAFLKVIDKRGEQASAESHLEAGLICLNHLKDPIEAIHHFRKYLELQPNAKQAPGVRGLIDTAKREIWRTMPVHPIEDGVVGIEEGEQLKQLQRENDELRARLDASRTATTTQFLRSSHATVEAGENSPATSSIPLITPAPAPSRPINFEPTITPAPSPAQLFPPVNPAPKGSRPVVASASGGRKHTVGAGDTLYNLAKKYGVKIEDLVAANRDVIPNVTSPLRKGVELKIP